MGMADPEPPNTFRMFREIFEGLEVQGLELDGGSVDFGILRAMTPEESAHYHANQTQEQWARELLANKLHFCGCTDDESYELVRDVLRLMPLHQGTSEQCRELIGSEGAFHIVLGAMTDADLITHGGNVGGSWMEPDGERLLGVLNAVADWDEFSADVTSFGALP